MGSSQYSKKCHKGTCGQGIRGNDVCPDGKSCCSAMGWCGTGQENCGGGGLERLLYSALSVAKKKTMTCVWPWDVLRQKACLPNSSTYLQLSQSCEIRISD